MPDRVVIDAEFVVRSRLAVDNVASAVHKRL
jgi:hypothetical protein